VDDCPASPEFVVISGGGGWTVAGSTATYTGEAVALPSTSSFVEPVDAVSTLDAELRFYGASTVVVAGNLTQNEIDAWYAVATVNSPQTVYAYMDALVPDKYVIAKKIQPASGDYMTNTGYPVGTGTGFCFVGISNDPIESE
jgi:hypothetical protein